MAMGDFEHILDQISTNRNKIEYTSSPVSDDYKKGWYDGYQAAQRQNPTITHPIIAKPIKMTTMCNVCGIDLGSGPVNFVCNQDSCPTRITAHVGAHGAGAYYTPMGGAGANGGTEIKS